jgi:hypothetical protein
MSDKTIIFRDIDKIKFIIKDATGLDIMYAYDDLIFPEHGAFIIRFDDENKDTVFCHFNKDCPNDERDRIFASLKATGKANNLKIVAGLSFEMVQKNETEVEIKFLSI